MQARFLWTFNENPVHLYYDLPLRDGDMKTFRENSAMEVLTALRSMEDMKLQQMHVALAISKCDELRSNREIAEYNKGNLFFMDVDNNLRNMRTHIQII